MLILLSSTASPTASRIATILREAFAATPLGIVLKALRENRAATTRSAGAVPARFSR
jgi:hypothetical protein